MNTTPQPKAATPPPTVNLPAPARGFMYVQVPEDLRASAITSQAVANLCRISGGDLVAGLDDDLKTLTGQVLLTGKKGKVVVTIALKPDGHKKVIVASDVKLTAPKTPPEPSILFATPAGQLLPRDPEQQELDLKVMQFESTTPREV